jgi:O-acetyl-ADP-ribose deacetylase (regulator of RNase III)
MLLASCYSTCLERGTSLGITRLAFCSISTGIYGYPLAAAAEVALRTTREYLQANPETSLRFVIFAMFGQQEHAVFQAALARLSSS